RPAATATSLPYTPLFRSPSYRSTLEDAELEGEGNSSATVASPTEAEGRPPLVSARKLSSDCHRIQRGVPWFQPTTTTTIKTKVRDRKSTRLNSSHVKISY